MEKGFNVYNKLVFIITMISIMVIGLMIKNSEDIYTWYRLLNLEAILISIWVISTLEIVSQVYFKVNLRDYINFIVIVSSVVLIYTNKDLLLNQPNNINIRYIGIKFGVIGAVFYIFPFLLYGYNKSIKSIIKVLTLFFSLYIISHIFTDRYKISTIGFLITAIFLIAMFILSSKESQIKETESQDKSTNNKE